MSDIEPRNAFEGIQSATILKPGDRVLVECSKGARRSDIDMLLAQLKGWFPDVKFAVIAGAQVVAVESAEVLDTTEATG